MSPAEALARALRLIPPKFNSLPAILLCLVIQRQENPLRRLQQIGGPAVGDYQFEKDGGIRGVLEHPKVGMIAKGACEALGVTPTPDGVYRALRLDGHDVLAAVFARLYLYTDPHPLPAIGDAEGAWSCYVRTWRPGAVQRDEQRLHAKWLTNYDYIAKHFNDMV